MDFFENIKKGVFFGFLFPVGFAWIIFCSFYLAVKLPNFVVSQIIMIAGLIALTFLARKIARKK